VSGVVTIVPQQVEIGSALDPQSADQIALGGVPRGATLVLTGSVEHDTVDVQNALAEHGYESVVMRSPASRLDLGFHAGIDQVADGLSHLATRGWSADQVGLVAFGVAGWVALHAAVAFELGAAISYSPIEADRFGADEYDIVLDAAPRLQTPWLGLMAGSVTTLEALDDALLGVARFPGGSTYVRVVGYAGVPQSFHEKTGDVRACAANYDAWQRAVEWLNQRVVPRPTPLELLWRSHYDIEAGR
jgi:carboxymethylenebutenolidase